MLENVLKDGDPRTQLAKPRKGVGLWKEKEGTSCKGEKQGFCNQTIWIQTLEQPVTVL